MTVSHKEIHNWWEGKVIIDELREYNDDRGLLCELWRNDDSKMISNNENIPPQMSYWSVTNPFYMRGPHQHSSQDDFFITFKGKMSYHLYNEETNEMKVFITDPNKITRVKVSVPIIHSYRNLEDKPIMTANFPTALFMGKNKKEEIDEIRWEPKFEHNQVVVVLGANGRLGKSLTNTFFNNMNFHNYDVIPVYNKINDSLQLQDTFNKLKDVIGERKTLVINCMAKTNTRDNSDFNWVNSLLPVLTATECLKNKWKMIHISSDFIYQQGKISNYSLSKIYSDNSLSYFNQINVIRVANLFSLEDNDTNMFTRFKELENIDISQESQVHPTCVDTVSEFIYNEFKKDKWEGKRTINLIPTSYYVSEICDMIGVKYNFVQSKLNKWWELWKTDKVEIVKVSSDNEIKQIINKVKGV